MGVAAILRHHEKWLKENGITYYVSENFSEALVTFPTGQALRYFDPLVASRKKADFEEDGYEYLGNIHKQLLKPAQTRQRTARDLAREAAAYRSALVKLKKENDRIGRLRRQWDTIDRRYIPSWNKKRTKLAEKEKAIEARLEVAETAIERLTTMNCRSWKAPEGATNADINEALDLRAAEILLRLDIFAANLTYKSDLYRKVKQFAGDVRLFLRHENREVSISRFRTYAAILDRMAGIDIGKNQEMVYRERDHGGDLIGKLGRAKLFRIYERFNVLLEESARLEHRQGELFRTDRRFGRRPDAIRRLLLPQFGSAIAPQKLRHLVFISLGSGLLYCAATILNHSLFISFLGIAYFTFMVALPLLTAYYIEDAVSFREARKDHGLIRPFENVENIRKLEDILKSMQGVDLEILKDVKGKISYFSYVLEEEMRSGKRPELKSALFADKEALRRMPRFFQWLIYFHEGFIHGSAIFGGRLRVKTELLALVLNFSLPWIVVNSALLIILAPFLTAADNLFTFSLIVYNVLLPIVSYGFARLFGTFESVAGHYHLNSLGWEHLADSEIDEAMIKHAHQDTWDAETRKSIYWRDWLKGARDRDNVELIKCGDRPDDILVIKAAYSPGDKKNAALLAQKILSSEKRSLVLIIADNGPSELSSEERKARIEAIEREAHKAIRSARPQKFLGIAPVYRLIKKDVRSTEYDLTRLRELRKLYRRRLNQIRHGDVGREVVASQVHGHLDRLETVLNWTSENGYRNIVFMGDIVGARPGEAGLEAMDRLRDHMASGITPKVDLLMGQTEHTFLLAMLGTEGWSEIWPGLPGLGGPNVMKSLKDLALDDGKAVKTPRRKNDIEEARRFEGLMKNMAVRRHKSMDYLRKRYYRFHPKLLETARFMVDSMHFVYFEDSHHNVYLPKAIPENVEWHGLRGLEALRAMEEEFKEKARLSLWLSNIMKSIWITAEESAEKMSKKDTVEYREAILVGYKERVLDIIKSAGPQKGDVFAKEKREQLYAMERVINGREPGDTPQGIFAKLDKEMKGLTRPLPEIFNVLCLSADAAKKFGDISPFMAEGPGGVEVVLDTDRERQKYRRIWGVNTVIPSFGTFTSGLEELEQIRVLNIKGDLLLVSVDSLKEGGFDAETVLTARTEDEMRMAEKGVKHLMDGQPRFIELEIPGRTGYVDLETGVAYDSDGTMLAYATMSEKTEEEALELVGRQGKRIKADPLIHEIEIGYKENISKEDIAFATKLFNAAEIRKSVIYSVGGSPRIIKEEGGYVDRHTRTAYRDADTKLAVAKISEKPGKVVIRDKNGRPILLRTMRQEIRIVFEKGLKKVFEIGAVHLLRSSGIEEKTVHVVNGKERFFEETISGRYGYVDLNTGTVYREGGVIIATTKKAESAGAVKTKDERGALVTVATTRQETTSSFEFASGIDEKDKVLAIDLLRDSGMMKSIKSMESITRAKLVNVEDIVNDYDALTVTIKPKWYAQYKNIIWHIFTKSIFARAVRSPGESNMETEYPSKLEDPLIKVIIHDLKNKLMVFAYCDLIMSYGESLRDAHVIADLELIKEYGDLLGKLSNATLGYFNGINDIEKALMTLNDSLPDLLRLTKEIAARLEMGGYAWDPKVKDMTINMVGQMKDVVIPLVQGAVNWLDRSMSLTDIEALIKESVKVTKKTGMLSENVAVEIGVADNIKALRGLHTYRLILAMAIQELLHNAAKYSHTDRIAITASISSAGEIEINVRDYGTGIPREKIDKIFSRGFTEASDKKIGTGYGLPNLREAIESVGGSIWAQSTYRRGALFSFTLPVNAPLDAAHKAKLSAPVIIAVSGLAGSGRGTISQYIAARLGLCFISRGDIARIVIYEMIKAKLSGKAINVEDESAATAFAERFLRSGRLAYSGSSLILDGEDIAEGAGQNLTVRDSVRAEIDRNELNTEMLDKVFSYYGVKKALDVFVKSQAEQIKSSGQYNGIVMKTTDPIVDEGVINIMLDAPAEIRAQRAKMEVDRIGKRDIRTGKTDAANTRDPGVHRIDTTALTHKIAESAVSYAVSQLPESDRKELESYLNRPGMTKNSKIRLDIVSGEDHLAESPSQHYLKYPNPRRPDLKLDDYDKSHYYWDAQTRYWRSKNHPRLVLGTYEDVVVSKREGAAPTDMENHVAIRIKAGYTIYVFDAHSFSKNYLAEAEERGEVPRRGNSQIFIDDHPDIFTDAGADAEIAYDIALDGWVSNHAWVYFNDEIWGRGDVLKPSDRLEGVGVVNSGCRYTRYFELENRPLNERAIFNIDSDASSDAVPLLDFIRAVHDRDGVTPSTVHISTSPPNCDKEEASRYPSDFDGLMYPEGFGSVAVCNNLAMGVSLSRFAAAPLRPAEDQTSKSGEHLEEKLAELVAIAENHDEPAVLTLSDLAQIGVTLEDAADLAAFANEEWERIGSNRRLVVDKDGRTIAISVPDDIGFEIFTDGEKDTWKGSRDRKQADVNSVIRRYIEQGRAVEILDDGAVARIRRNRSNPLSPPLKARFKAEGILDNIQKAKDPALLEKIVRSSPNFSILDPKEKKKLIAAAKNITLSVILGRTSVFDRMKSGKPYTILSHMRQGLTKHIPELSPTVWIGEKVLVRLSPKQIARVLLEEAQHLVRPFTELKDGTWKGLHKMEYPEGTDPKKYIVHDEAFMKELMEVVLSVNRDSIAAFDKPPVVQPVKVVPLENEYYFDKAKWLRKGSEAIPVSVFEDHDKVFEWLKSLQAEGITDADTTIINFDTHADAIKEVFEELNIGTWMRWAKLKGVSTGRRVWVKSGKEGAFARKYRDGQLEFAYGDDIYSSIKDMTKKVSGPAIITIDYDYIAPKDGGYITREEIGSRVRQIVAALFDAGIEPLAINFTYSSDYLIKQRSPGNGIPAESTRKLITEAFVSALNEKLYVFEAAPGYESGSSDMERKTPGLPEGAADAIEKAVKADDVTPEVKKIEDQCVYQVASEMGKPTKEFGSFFATPTPMALRIIHYLKYTAGPNAKLCDLGSGNGAFSFFAAPHFSNVTGIEGVTEFFDAAKKNQKELVDIPATGKVSFVNADFLDEPTDLSSYDALYFFYTKPSRFKTHQEFADALRAKLLSKNGMKPGATLAVLGGEAVLSDGVELLHEEVRIGPTSFSVYTRVVVKPVPAGKERGEKLKAESAYKDYFETLFEFNLKLFVLMARRMKAKRISDQAALVSAKNDTAKCLADLMREMDDFEARLKLLSQDIQMPDSYKKARQEFSKAKDLIAKDNEPAANATLVAALNVVSKAREGILKSRMSSPRVRINVSKKDGKIVMRQQAYVKAEENAKTLVPKYIEKTFDLRWQAGRSLDDQEDSILDERQKIAEYLVKLEKYQAAITTGQMLTAENISDILSGLKGVIVEEKRLARIALTTAVELIQLGEAGSVKHLLPIVWRYFILRMKDIDNILLYIRAGRIEPFREIVTKDNADLIGRAKWTEELLKKGSYWKAHGNTYGLMKVAREYLAEPDLDGLQDVLGPVLGHTKKLAKGGMSADEEKAEKARADFWAGLARKKLEDSQRLSQFMEAFRTEYARRRISASAPYLKEDTFIDVFETFIKDKQLILGSPHANSFQMLCYLAAFISMEDPVFAPVNTLRLMVEIDDIETILKVKRLQKFSKTIAALKAMKEKGRIRISDLKLEEPKELVKAMAREKEFDLDEAGRLRLAKAFAPSKSFFRRSLSSEELAALSFGKFAEECRAEMSAITSYIEKNDLTGAAHCVDKVFASADNDFRSDDLDDFRELVRDQIARGGLAVLKIAIHAPLLDEIKIAQCLDGTEKALQELEKLAAAKKLLDAVKEWMENGYLDVAKVLAAAEPAKSSMESVEPQAGPKAPEMKTASEDAQKLAAINKLFQTQLNGASLNDGPRILLSENLFIKDGDDRDLVAIKAALGSLLREDGPVAILKPDEIRRKAINKDVTKEKMAIVLTKEDFASKEIWNGSDKETSLRSSVLIIDDKMTGNNYLYLEGVVGLARAVMARNRQAIREYYRMISGVAIDDQILQLLKDDDQNNIAFAVKAILRFKPISMIVDSEEFNKTRIMMENALIAA